MTRSMGLLAVALTALVGCYRVHEREANDAEVDGSFTPDTPVADTFTDAPGADAPMDAGGPPVPTGCVTYCDAPRLVARVALGATPPRAFADLQSTEAGIVVLLTRPVRGHSPPAHRIALVQPETGEVSLGEVWAGSGTFPQHHGGAVLLPSSDGRIRAITLMGAPHFSMPLLPTGRQAVSVHRLTWSSALHLESDETLSALPDDDTLGCIGGCDAGVALTDTSVVITYAPNDRLFTTTIPLDGGPASPWVELGAIDDDDPAPWPHAAVVVGGQTWIAGGGTAEFEQPRPAWLLPPGGAARSMIGTALDLPPLIVGGSRPVLARHVQAEHAFVVQALDDSRPAVRVATSGPAPLGSQLAWDPFDRRMLLYTTYAPGALRDTIVSIAADVRPSECASYTPASLLRLPGAVPNPAVAAVSHQGRTFVFGFPVEGGTTELAVFEVAPCRLAE